jgi:hypothetical protein
MINACEYRQADNTHVEKIYIELSANSSVLHGDFSDQRKFDEGVSFLVLENVKRHGLAVPFKY